MAGAQFTETEDSFEASAENVVEATWSEVSKKHPRLRKGMLREALNYWLEEGYVVVPDDYMER